MSTGGLSDAHSLLRSLAAWERNRRYSRSPTEICALPWHELRNRHDQKRKRCYAGSFPPTTSRPPKTARCSTTSSHGTTSPTQRCSPEQSCYVTPDSGSIAHHQCRRTCSSSVLA